MTKNVLAISSTLRKDGNSEILLKEFLNGAKKAGHNVDFVTLKDKDIKFCKGCLACQKTGSCVIKDDSIEIVEKMKNADVIAFSTPIYYYEMSGQLKTLLDRANALYSSDYKFREIYFMATAADMSPNASDIALLGIKGWISCFPKAQLKGSVLGAGAETVGDIKNNPAIKKAFKMGENV